MSILLFFIILIVLIVVHEFGHFIVAKKMGIRVDEFGIGFPPRALTLWHRGETRYTLNWLPFGGFVKIFGENPDEASLHGQESARSFAHQSKFVQVLVLVAGVSFNVLLAWFIFFGVFASGAITPAGGEMRSVLNGAQLAVLQVVPASPAEQSGFMPGDIIVSVASGEESVDVLTPEHATTFISEHKEKVINFHVTRDGEEILLLAEPRKGLIPDDSERFAIGISMGLVGDLSLSPHLAFLEATKLTWKMLSAITLSLASFFASAFTLSADLSQITGPVGIVGLVGDAASLGIVSVLMFSAFISLNLAVINLLPIPALDGGRILFVLIEAIKGSPIKPQIGNALNTFGFAFLILLMFLVTYNDIVRIIG